MSEKEYKTWSNEIEQLLISWSEKALCYRWLHQTAQNNYQKYHHHYIIPIIVLSTLTGTANFGLNSIVPAGYENIASMGIGGINLFTGLLTTLLNFFRYAELKQSHENSVKLWYKYHISISTEIALEPSKRQDPNKFFSWCKVEYEKILENSPMIPEDVIKHFRKRYKNVIKQKIVNLPEVIVPIEHARLYQEYMKDYQKTLKRLNEDSNTQKKNRLEDEINANIDSSRSYSPTTDESNTNSPSVIKPDNSPNSALTDIEKKFERIMNEDRV
jgi:hypothetical protein